MGNRRSRAKRQPRPELSNAGLRSAAYLQTAGAALWIGQAGMLAWAVGRVAEGAGLGDILPAALGVLGLGLVKSLLEARGNRMAFLSARRILSARRQAALATLARQSPLDPERMSSGEAASILGEQADLITPYLSRFQPARFKSSALPVLILAVVLPVSWAAALILLVAMPLIPLFMALIGLRAQAASEKQLASTGGLNGFLLDRLRGLATLRAMGAIGTTSVGLAAHGHDLRRRTMSVLRIAFLSSAVLELFAALGVAMIAVYVGFSLLGTFSFGAWGHRLDLAHGLFLLLLAPAFFEPLRELSAVWHDRASGEAALKAMDSLAAARLALVEPLRSAGPTAPAVNLSNVSFRYRPDHAPALDHISLDIRCGEHLALVGASGSGKSTVLAMIAGLAAPDSGSVVLHETCRIAWIGQQPHIFSGSLSGNILLGRRQESPAEDAVGAALDFARLGHLRQLYHSRSLGDSGRGLSGGEAVRLAIARAAADPDINLILADEPTAHLDAATAEDVIEQLLVLAASRTLVVASHDPRLIARMHRAVSLEPCPLQEAAE